ncbi:hypothetical protein C8Q75DRAFT_809238 [Abortiporus biennis]|nr:hypothetical protein C8Q75DRAFT_809238 [Abortiporus biennis]
MGYDEFMSIFTKCNGGEANETEDISKIAAKIAKDFNELDQGQRTQIEELFTSDLIQPAWDGTEYVARNVSYSSEDANLDTKTRPDIAGYKRSKNGASMTDFDLSGYSGDKNRTPVSHQDVSATPRRNDSFSPVSPDHDLHCSDNEATDLEDKTNGECGLPIEDTSDESSSRSMVGQISDHISAVMKRQHRTHFFSVVIIANTTRFLRWDCAGVIVTEPITFKEDLARFIKFFYRFAQMSPEDQGEDASILEADDKDLQCLYKFQVNKVPTLVPNHRKFFEHAFVKNKDQFPIVKVYLDRMPPVPPSAPDRYLGPSGNTLRLLIGAPSTHSYSLFGKRTKGFIAFDLDEKRLKFIKDRWRYNDQTYHPELEVYKGLQENIKLVPYTGTKLAIAEGRGDVKDSNKTVQKSFTDIVLNTEWAEAQKMVLPQRHYQSLIRQVGTPSERYKESSRSLCSLVTDAMNGMSWSRMGRVLHQNISPDTILIDEDPEGGSRDQPQGFLHDWDLSNTMTVNYGTWPFVSASLLYYPNKQHNLADDLESFVHIIYWFCIRFHRHDLTADEIAAELSDTYLRTNQVNGFDIGSKKKIEMMRSGQPFVDLNKSNKIINKGLHVIAENLAQFCQQHYRTIDFRTLDAGRARILGLPTLKDAPPTEGATEEDSVDPVLAARWGVATLPDGDSDNKPLDDKVTPPSPFSSHNLIISTFNAVLAKAKYWPLADKLGNQFTKLDLPSSDFIFADGIAQSCSQAIAGKRSASTVFEDDGPSQKRSRTSGQIDDSES